MLDTVRREGRRVTTAKQESCNTYHLPRSAMHVSSCTMPHKWLRHARTRGYPFGQMTATRRWSGSARE